MTKILLVVVNKSHAILVTNNKGVLDEKKSQQIQIHCLTPLYMYCHMWLKCDNFGHYWHKMMCCHLSQYLIIWNTYYYYFEIIWDFQFTCLDYIYYNMWSNVNMPHGTLKWIQNTNIMLVGT